MKKKKKKNRDEMEVGQLIYTQVIKRQKIMPFYFASLKKYRKRETVCEVRKRNGCERRIERVGSQQILTQAVLHSSPSLHKRSTLSLYVYVYVYVYRNIYI